MPKDPKGRKRPADVIANAVHVMRIATGEIDETALTPKNTAAAELGRQGGLSRAKNTSKKRRREIAKRAAAKRWKERPR